MDHPEHWSIEDNVLTRTFVFKDFMKAVSFINKVAPLAEQADHHPDIELFSYKKVKVKLTTHDVGNKITMKDIELAKKINRL